MTGPWRTSSRSAGGGGNCVQTRMNDHQAQVRDSKLGDGSPLLSLSRTEYTALLDSIKN